MQVFKIKNSVTRFKFLSDWPLIFDIRDLDTRFSKLYYRKDTERGDHCSLVWYPLKFCILNFQ